MPPIHAADVVADPRRKPRRRSTPQTPASIHPANPFRALLGFFFFFSPLWAVGCGVVVVVVVWVDRRWWVAGFVGISGLWLGSSASVGGSSGYRGGGCGCCRRSTVIVDADRSACSPIGWVSRDFFILFGLG